MTEEPAQVANLASETDETAPGDNAVITEMPLGKNCTDQQELMTLTISYYDLLSVSYSRQVCVLIEGFLDSFAEKLESTARKELSIFEQSPEELMSVVFSKDEAEHAAKLTQKLKQLESAKINAEDYIKNFRAEVDVENLPLSQRARAAE